MLKRQFLTLLLFLLTIISSLTGFAGSSAEVLYSNAYDYRSDHSQWSATFKHSNTWAKGDNFVFVDVLAIDDFSGNGSLYGEWAPRMSIGKVFLDRPLSAGLVKDIYLMGELNTSLKDSKSNTVKLYGFSVDLNLPGFTFAKVHLERRDDSRKEGTSAQVSLIWKIPIQISEAHFTFEGFLDYATAEGNGSANLLTQPQLLWEIQPNLHAGFEYQYWDNKFGTENLRESALQIMLRLSF